MAHPLRALAILFVVLVAALAGCARHIDVIPIGKSPAPDACVVEVDVVSDLTKGRAAGTVVELYREPDLLITRFTTTADGPTPIVDLEPGDYRLAMRAPPGAGARTISKRFTLEPGRKLALRYDDNERARRFWRNVGVGAGVTLVFATAIAVDGSLMFFSCGVYHHFVFTAIAVKIADKS